MSIPDWITLSGTSGSGDGSISVTAAVNTTRNKSRFASFNIKNESGMVRTVKVYQAGAEEVLTIDPESTEIHLGATSGSFTITGTSNAQSLVVRTSGNSTLTPLSYRINGTPFTSGEVIAGDPGLNGTYTYSLTFSYSANSSNNDRSMSVFVSTVSGKSVSCAVAQDHSGDVDYDTGGVPKFTNNAMQEVPSKTCVLQAYVNDADNVGWSIVVEGTNITALPSSGNLAQVLIVDNTSLSDQLLYIHLVPYSAYDTSQGIYDTITLRQQAQSLTRMSIDGGEVEMVAQYVELQTSSSGVYDSSVLTVYYNDAIYEGAEVMENVSGASWLMVDLPDRYTDSTGKVYPRFYYSANTTGSIRTATVTFSATRNGSTGSVSITIVQPSA